MASEIKNLGVISTVVCEENDKTELYRLLNSVSVNMKYGNSASFNVLLEETEVEGVFAFNVGCRFTNDDKTTDRRIDYDSDDNANITINFVNFGDIETVVMHDVCSDKHSLVGINDTCDLCADFNLHFINDDARNVVLTVNFYSHTTVVDK